MSAQLNIEEYFVDELIVRTNTAYAPGKKPIDDVDVAFHVRRKGQEPLFMISMAIELNKAKKSFAASPYYVAVKLSGFFSFQEGTDEDTIQNMLGLNALAILYGVARGVVGQATASGIFGKCVLPSVNFVELVKKQTGKKSKKHT